MDTEMLMNIIIHILAFFGLILLLFLFVKLVLWCLLCDIDQTDNVKKTKLKYQLNRIEENEAKNARNNLKIHSSQSYRRASEPLPEDQKVLSSHLLRRSPEVERLNSDNITLISPFGDDRLSLTSEDEEILINEEIEKVIRDSNSSPVHYAEVDRTQKTKNKNCVTRNDSKISACVCPFCPKSGRSTAEPLNQVTDDHKSNDTDNISLIIEPDVEREKNQNKEEESQKQEKEDSEEKSQQNNILCARTAIQELDSALEEIDNAVIEMIHESESKTDDKSETKTQKPETKKNIIKIEMDKPKVPEKPKAFVMQSASNAQPQCQVYYEVVNQMKERHSQIINSDTVLIPE